MTSNNGPGTSASPRRHVADIVYEAASRAATSRTLESHIDELPALSLYAFATSLMTLGGRIIQMGKFELGIAEIISWQRPALTWTFLFGYTTLCYHPQWIAVLPLFYFVMFILVPNYAEKFQIDTDLNKHIALGQATSVNVEGLGEIPNAEAALDEKQKQTKSMLTAIRKGQKTLLGIVQLLDKFDEFRNGPAKFSDPQISCVLLVISASALLVSSYGLTYLSMPFLFTFIGWAVVGLKHPLAKLTTEKIEELYIEPSLDIETLRRQFVAFCHSKVLIDEPPICRIVEIFELQPQGLTARQWNSEETIYSRDPYFQGSEARLQKQPPAGSADLSDVMPPRGWYFDLGDNWKPDIEPEMWLSSHKLEDKLYHRKAEIHGGWVHDVGEQQLDQEAVWRRRRLTRECYYDYR